MTITLHINPEAADRVGLARLTFDSSASISEALAIYGLTNADWYRASR